MKEKSKPQKVFISYSSKDYPKVSKIYQYLTQAGVECFFDKESIGWGMDIVISIKDALQECDAIIPCYSPNSLAPDSDWPWAEMSSILMDDPLGAEGSFRPLMISPCHGLIPKFVKRLKYLDITTDKLFSENLPKILDDLGMPSRPVKGAPDFTTMPPDRQIAPAQ